MRHVKLIQVDGALPNLALMRISAWHKKLGDHVTFSRNTVRELGEPDYDLVYASAIFSKSAPKVAEVRSWWPDALIGGTWTDIKGENGEDLNPRVEDVVPSSFSGLDYDIYPEFPHSIGYASRGCRFKCGFCRVPGLEGRPNSFVSINDLWRGEGHPRNIHLLDNDFFSSPEWRDRIDEMREGKFRVCFSQGLNIRIISDEQAIALATIEYRDNHFKRSRLYTAWDNLGDERVFFRGVDRLEKHGIPPHHLMAYSLVGWDEQENWEKILYRHQKMVERGVRPYVMIHENARDRDPEGSAPDWKALKKLQRWTNMGLYRAGISWENYDVSYKTARHVQDERQMPLL